MILKRFSEEWLKQAMRNDNNVAQVEQLNLCMGKNYTNYVSILNHHTGARNYYETF